MGKVAMMINGQWNPYWAQEYAPELEYGVGPIPAPKAHPERTGAAWLGGNLFCLPVGAKHPEEAWKLQAWMQTPEAQRLFANEMHGIPNRKSVISEPSLRTGEPWRVQYGKFMDYATGQYSSHFPVMPIANLYNTSMFDSVDMVTTGQKTAKQAMEDVKVRVQRELDRYQ
jgi:multiple sugar transport system substrate-binding protein